MSKSQIFPVCLVTLYESYGNGLRFFLMIPIGFLNITGPTFLPRPPLDSLFLLFNLSSCKVFTVTKGDCLYLLSLLVTCLIFV